MEALRKGVEYHLSGNESSREELPRNLSMANVPIGSANQELGNSLFERVSIASLNMKLGWWSEEELQTDRERACSHAETQNHASGWYPCLSSLRLAQDLGAAPSSILWQEEEDLR